jgi:hypothetical protein
MVMGMPAYLVEMCSIQGHVMRFGPYSRPRAERLAREFSLRIGGDDVTVASARTSQGTPAGAWSISGRSIASVTVTPITAVPTGHPVRLGARRWSKPALV